MIDPLGISQQPIPHFSSNGRASAHLARDLTKSGSKQSYLIARLMVNGKLTDDCLRAYGYFRWADDMIDEPARSCEERIAFIRRQMELVDHLYKGGSAQILEPEEQIIADLIAHDQSPASGLQSYIRNFMAILEFDACRKGTHISHDELDWYSDTLALAVMDAMQYFSG
jgi:hypothetical protein